MKVLSVGKFVLMGVILVFNGLVPCLQATDEKSGWSGYYSARTAQNSYTYDDRVKLRYVAPGIYADILNERVDWDLNHRRYMGGSVKLQINKHIKYEYFNREARDYSTDSIKFYQTLNEGDSILCKAGLTVARSNWNREKYYLYMGASNDAFQVDYSLNENNSIMEIAYKEKIEKYNFSIKPSLEFRNLMPSNIRHFKTSLSIKSIEDIDIWGINIRPSLSYENTEPDNRTFFHFKVEVD